MTGVGTRDIQPLNWDVLVTPGIPIATSELPPGQKQAMFQAIASTLIYGERDAVLVDAFMTVKQADALVDWVAASGKNLTTIYITHGHGDHWFGNGALLERFPNARAVARPDIVRVMRQQASPEFLEKFWKAGFPGQIPDRLVIAEELKGNVIDLEADHTTCLNVPSVGLVVAGDAAYNDVHSPSQMRRLAGSGSLHSTKLSRSTHVQLSPRISDPVTTTIPGSSSKPGSTYAISTD
jgi:glyoxylase-like metal-dependent hydrolase (beta-lactamase superfamily II)